MATKIITITLSLLVVTTGVQSQFFDLFQGYQPFQPTRHTTKQPDYNIYPQESQDKKSKGEASYTNNDRQIKEQTRRPPSHSYETSNRQTNKQTNKRKHTTIASLFNLNFFTTPATTRKTKNSNRRNSDTNNSQNNDSKESIENLYKRDQNSNYDNKKRYDESLNNIVNEYQTSRPTTKPAFITAKPNHASTKHNRVNTRPNYATTENYYETNRPSNDVNSFSTLTPGVRPANVDLSKPPITNKPSYAVYPRPTDSSVIRFPEDPDTSPEVISGPDEDQMSNVEKRRYIEVAEKMCDKYKSLNVKKLEAIPLVPSPEPVRVNVSVCPPTKVPLVVGGKVVTIQEFPHMALLGWTKLQGGGYSWKCGGSLISDQYVLTAAHCAYQDKDDTVVTGAPRVVQLGSSYLDDAGALVMRVSLVVRHPKYLRTRSYYDIALLKLVEPVTFSEVVKPACLGVPPGVGEPIIATGWGRTEFGGSQSLELRSVSVPVWDINECHQILGTSRKLPNGPSRDNQICAGEKQGGKDTCQGDSGGPAQIQDGCSWRIVAVTSVGRSCGAPNTPALYATILRAFVAAQIYGKGMSTQQTSQNVDKQDYTTVNSNNRNTNNANIHNDRANLSSHKNNDYVNPENVNVNNNHKQNTNIQDYININNNNNRNVNINNNNERGGNLNVNNKNNNGYIITDDVTSGSHRQNVNYNNNYTPHVISDYGETESGNNNYNQNQNYENKRPSTSYNKAHSIRSPDDIYNPSPHNNEKRYHNGYNGKVNANNNYDVGFHDSYMATEAPRFNNGRNWWQPY